MKQLSSIAGGLFVLCLLRTVCLVLTVLTVKPALGPAPSLSDRLGQIFAHWYDLTGPVFWISASAAVVFTVAEDAVQRKSAGK